MKRNYFKTKSPEDRSLSPYTGWTRAHWEEVFRDLTRGFIKYSTPSKSMIRYPGGHGSFYDARTDGLEGFARMLWMVAPYLHHRKDGRIKLDGRSHDLAAQVRTGILAGTDPKAGDDYWGDIRTRHQTIVEAAAVAINLFISRHLTWDRFSKKEKDQVASWLQQIIEKEPYTDNWVLFKVCVNAALKCFGYEYSRLEINQYLDYMANFYTGNGWYTDGYGPCYEYYNAWTIHPYFLFWAWMDGDSRPELLSVLKERTRLFTNTYKYYFAGNGVHPPFGRSLLYRMAAVAVFPVAELFNCTSLSAGQARRICSGNLKYFVDQGAIEGHRMTMGFNHEYLPLPEMYSSAQSPYWGAKAWWTFLLKPDHPFWTCAEEPLEVEKRSYVVAIPGNGQIVQGSRDTGQVTVFVNNSGNWVKKKYANFAWSSHFGFEITVKNECFNYEGGLSVSTDGKQYGSRMFPIHIATADCFSASYYCPFKLDENKPWAGNLNPAHRIYTNLIVKDNFHLRIHRVVAKRNFQLFEGGMALGWDRGKPVKRSGRGWEYCAVGKKFSFIKNLYGYNRQIRARGFMANPKGNNMLNDYSIVPALNFKGRGVDGGVFASLVCADLNGRDPKQLNALVDIFTVKGNLIYIRFYDGEEIYTQAGEWRDIFVALKGKKVTGRVLCARADTSGRLHIVNHDGSLVEY